MMFTVIHTNVLIIHSGFNIQNRFYFESGLQHQFSGRIWNVTIL